MNIKNKIKIIKKLRNLNFVWYTKYIIKILYIELYYKGVYNIIGIHVTIIKIIYFLYNFYNFDNFIK